MVPFRDGENQLDAEEKSGQPQSRKMNQPVQLLNQEQSGVHGALHQTCPPPGILPVPIYFQTGQSSQRPAPSLKNMGWNRFANGNEMVLKFSQGNFINLLKGERLGDIKLINPGSSETL